MYLLIEVAGYIDAWPTILLVMLTAVIGVALLKRQGLATLTRGVGRMNAGEVPAREMAEGILLAVAGALLLTPGFITDFVGFVLLFPPSRMALASKMLQRVQAHTVGADPFGPQMGAQNAPEQPPGEGPVTLDGDFERKG